MKCLLQDPHILARKFADRWLRKSLGVGLFKRPLWRRETDDERSRLLRTISFGIVAANRMVRPSLPVYCHVSWS